MTVDRRWYRLGRYEIFAKPLETNPFWTTHHIYLRGECIGKQLSVPCETDCDWYASGARYAEQSSAWKPSYLARCRKAGPGRPRKSRRPIVAEHPIEGELGRIIATLT